jgi:hypothetical protein
MFVFILIILSIIGLYSNHYSNNSEEVLMKFCRFDCKSSNYRIHK